MLGRSSSDPCCTRIISSLLGCDTRCTNDYAKSKYNVFCQGHFCIPFHTIYMCQMRILQFQFRCGYYISCLLYFLNLESALPIQMELAEIQKWYSDCVSWCLERDCGFFLVRSKHPWKIHSIITAILKLGGERVL